MSALMFWRIRCHFCNSRQPHSKSVTDFQCSVCEAVNFFDGKGNVVETPASIAAQNGREQSIPLTFSRPTPATLEHQHTKAFCRTCTQNQHLYNETLSNYLPDESHPQYKQYEKAIPQYKEELEKRYPLICKACAPAAQSKINRADYYGMTQNAGKLASATRARGGMPAYRTRDDGGKRFMRMLLRLIGLMLYLGIFAQVTYHAYGIFYLIFGTPISTPDLNTDDFHPLSPSLSECAQQSMRLHFNTACYQQFSSLIPRSLALAVCFLWYNPGISAWYHHTHRMEAIHGQKNYFYMQAIVLVFRAWAWYNLTNPETYSSLGGDQLFAVHGFAILFMLVTQSVANRSITPEIWRMKGTIMPHPGELDVLSANAGPAPEHYTPKASEKDPWRYLRREEKPPFDINLLAPKQQQKPAHTKPTSSYLTHQQPSPDLTDEYDAMETDFEPVMRSSRSFTNTQQRSHLQPSHSFSQHGYATGIGFGNMTDQVFNMQTRMRQEEERKRMEQEQQKLRFQPKQREPSPFYGRLPPAPMSMERRLRNPVVQPVEPQKIPLSQQKSFMAQMRAGIKPVQFPEKGTNFELKKSEWVLPGDVKETGLEDRFTTSFNLAEPAPPGLTGSGGYFGFLRR